MAKAAKVAKRRKLTKVAKPVPLWRFWVLVSFLALLPVALFWQLINLQVLPSAERGYRFLQGEGAARTLRSEQLNAYRGVITDRNGELLAVSTPLKSIYANPQELNVKQLPELARALNIKPKALRERLASYEEKQFVYLSRHLPPHEAEQVLSRKFSGVRAETEYRRFYPAGEVAAHIVGMTDIDDRGQEGIERAFDAWLRGEHGVKRVVKDLKGNVVKELGLLKSPVAGSDMQLTIDLRLQYLAHRELKAEVARQAAKSGSVVLLDVRSGEILAMANHPSYNPNDRSRIEAYQTRNRAITDVFEPGSTMKPFTVLAALETGRFHPEYTIDTSPGYVRLGGKTFVDPVNYGVVDLTKIITKSSQVGISKLAMELDPQHIRDVYYRLGVGQSTGIGFPGENIGQLPNRNRWHPVEIANFSFGYGLSLNAVQLAQAYRTIAADGEFRFVSLIRNAEPQPSSLAVSSKLAKEIKKMLFTVTQKGGTGTRAHSDAYPSAGKSGTAHKTVRGGYADDRYISIFAGMAPYENPEIVAVVVVHEPSRGKYYGGEVAAPVFGKVVESALQILRVPPANAESQVVRVAGAG